MPPSLTTRKPINKITPADLEAFPIWEFASDEEGVPGKDETWIRPVKNKTIPADAYALSVAADYQTAAGETYPGIVGVTTAGGLEFGHGALLADRHYLFVPSSDYWRAKDARAALANALGVPEGRLFPMRFTLRVRIAGEKAPRTGEF